MFNTHAFQKTHLLLKHDNAAQLYILHYSCRSTIMQKLFNKAFTFFPLWFIIAIWVIHIYGWLTSGKLTWLGTHPMHFKEWYTFLSGALIHGSWKHLLNNTYPLAITGLFLVFLYGRFSNFVFITSYFFTGLFIFLLARQNTYHIGASGVAYCWAFLLAASGVFRKDRLSLGLGLAVAFLYGGMIWGVLPGQPGVSWDGHLVGALTGILFAYLYRNVNQKETISDSFDGDQDDEGYDAIQYDNSPYRYIQKQINRHKEE